MSLLSYCEQELLIPAVWIQDETRAADDEAGPADEVLLMMMILEVPQEVMWM